MNPRYSYSSRRLSAALWAALLPLAASAESIVFNADFSGSANTVSVTPSVISPKGATWYGAYNKTNGAITVDGSTGLTLNATTGSSSAAINGAGRITQSPINLAAINDYIELSGSFYTDGLTNVAFGIFNSGGVDPLATLLNNGLANSGTAPGGGTFGWKGYRAMTLNGSTAGNFIARQAQTGTAYGSYELLSPGTGGFNSPGSIATGTPVNSTTSMDWNNTDGFTLYNFVFRITRTGADALSFSHTIRSSDNTTVLYSATGVTNAASQPSTITSSFDAIGFGGRVNSLPLIQFPTLKVTAKNTDIAKITTQPVAQNIATAGSGSISVASAGTGTLSYQWYQNGSPVSGATSATYNITNASSANAGDYYVVVSNAYGYEISNTVAVNVSPVSAPVFTTQPATKAVDAGTPLTLTSEASGVPTPTYQWYLNDSPISGATLATYTVAYATTVDAGTYKVIATNSQGSATSNNATVTINTAAPAITTQPSPVTVNVGAAITLTAAASGLPAPSYQWYRNDVAIDGATASSYFISSATTAIAGTYTVRATNTYGTATSNGALVTVNVVLPSFTTQPPAALTVHQGKRITLNAAYDGSSPRTYQWYKGSDPITGATGTTYTIASPSSADSGSYHVVVTNEGGSATSNNTSLSVVGTSETPILSTTFAGNTKNDPAALITSSSTSWFILAGRDATNSSVGDDSTTTEVVETRPLTLTWVGTAGSAIVETAARFSATPVALSTPGDYLNVRTTFSGTNLRTICFGLYDSHGVLPVALDTASNNMGHTTAVGTGTQNWTGYRSSLTIGNSGGDIGTRPAQTTTSTNRGQELLFPAGSTGAAFGEPPGVSIGLIPSVGATIALNNNTTYTLDYTITLSATNQYTIAYSLYDGASATGTPLYTTNATTSVTAAQPSSVATSFDSLAIGLRNNDANSSPTLVFTNLSVTKGVAAASVPESAYDTWASSQGLTVGVNDGETQDPDNDGVKNVLEFVLGGNPLASSSAILPVATKSGSNLVFTFNLKVAATVEYTIGTESSTDLATWTPVVHGVGGATIVETQVDANTDQVVVTVPASGARTFLRLKVTAKP